MFNDVIVNNCSEAALQYFIYWKQRTAS